MMNKNKKDNVKINVNLIENITIISVLSKKRVGVSQKT